MTFPAMRSWALVFLAALFVATYVPFLNETRVYLTAGHRDFPSFYYAAAAAFGDGRSPYEPAYLEALAGTRVFPFIYTPPALLVLAPLALVPYEVAKLAFLGLNHLIVLGLLGGTLFPLLRLRADVHAAVIGFAIVYVFNFQPLFVQLAHGQVNLLLAVLMLFAWLALQRGWARTVGVTLGLAVALKTYPLLLLGFLAIHRRWREIGWTVATVVVLTGMSFAVLPRAAWDDWSRDVAPAAGYGVFETASSARALRWPGGTMSPAGVENQSVNGFFARLLTENKVQRPLAVMPGLAKALTYAVNVVFVLVSAAVVFAAWRRGTGDIDGLVTLTLLLMYLAAPISWEHHLVYLIPAILVLGVRAFELPTLRGVALAAWLGAAMLLAAPFLLRVKIVGIVILWAVALYATWKGAAPGGRALDESPSPAA
jgi:alpha-1,2-mannosyltransferase